MASSAEVSRSRSDVAAGRDSGFLKEGKKFAFIPLDNFRNILHNKGIRTKLEAWLTFLSIDDPEWIGRLIDQYPQFRRYYEEIYELCLSTEKVMGMFSKELQELDRNTVQYMIDEMQDKIDEQKKDLGQKQDIIEKQKREIERLKAELESRQPETDR
ncbi:hypothetical protein LKD70_05145 [Ruminococcus sp. CLA-AA-H200]|uniref:PD-(D/E)XK nuclease family transposase n=1 Tax=Ruminococcus turbiniformis TaxID=2881258 RepID=A0ABS8FW72_9FIRM|nr:hypothetical protein [Ruminococcus turbiniformis]MCC2253824.1 hypothetical protein [Ruminococcus turbiniformis]